VPTKAELVKEIGAVLRRVGATYAAAGTRDKHYGIWIFSLAFDEARNGRGAALQGLRPGPEAVFRGKPSDLNSGAAYTHAQALGAKRDWEVHVDINMLGASGVTHGVDVSVIPDTRIKDARTKMRPPLLSGSGLGVEAKCFGSKITPNEGRVTLGFQLELGSVFWLVATTTNKAVQAMLRTPGRKTDFFGDAIPGSPSEAELRRAFAAHFNR
jgi:hypothetical protein